MKKPRNMSREELWEAISSGNLPSNDIIRNHDILLRVWKLSKKHPDDALTVKDFVDCVEVLCRVIDNNRACSGWDNYQPMQWEIN